MDDATTLLFALPDYRVLEAADTHPPGTGSGASAPTPAAARRRAADPSPGAPAAHAPPRRTRHTAGRPPHQSPPRPAPGARHRARGTRSFTEATGELPPRSRLTGRLRERV